MSRSLQPRTGRLTFLVVGATALLFAITTLHTPKDSHLDGQADRLVVDKGHHTLTLLRHGEVVKTYAVAL